MQIGYRVKVFKYQNFDHFVILYFFNTLHSFINFALKNFTANEYIDMQAWI